MLELCYNIEFRFRPTTTPAAEYITSGVRSKAEPGDARSLIEPRICIPYIWRTNERHDPSLGART